jgi:2-polyprenyl-3-methyl-5-hydroxy-6-metoxy-1,4-benzoquinol methylase
MRWDSGRAPLTCRVCGFAGDGDVVLVFTAPLDGEEHRAIRCPGCDSIELLDVVQEFGSDDAMVDFHLEVGAGVGTIAGLIDSAGPAQGARLLDVGCAFGISVAYAAFRGWDAVGVEPGYAGRRGREELGVDIRDGVLESGLDLGGPFAVILASEVLEHVPDPEAFLRSVIAHLDAHGQLILTTPDAALLDPTAPEGDLYSVVSPGLHHFLASREGLEDLLRRAGFTTIRIDRLGLSHRVLARVDDRPIVDDLTVSDVEPFYLEWGRRTRGAVSVGLWTRAFRSAVARGDFDLARSTARPMEAAFQAHHRVNPRQPASVRRFHRRRRGTSGALPGACFGWGMIELLDGDPRHAVRHFEGAIAGVDAVAALAGPDADSADIRIQAVFHRLLALARVDPLRAGHEALADDLSPERLCRVFVELVARGKLAQAGPLAVGVAAIAPTLAGTPGPHQRPGLDALYCLGTLAAQTGRPADARTWFAMCVTLAEASDDDNDRSVSDAAAAGLALVGGEADPRGIPTELSHMIDIYWSDPFGMFIDGWVHHEGDPGVELTVEADGRSVTASRHRRDDLRTFWEQAPDVHRSGFRAYLPGRPSTEVSLVALFGASRRVLTIPVPDRRLPELDPGEHYDVAIERITTFAASAPDGPVLSIGARVSDAETVSFADSVFGEREIVGMDIHPGFRVDIVGDAHQLSTTIDPGRFPIVFSASLLEHVSAPWLVAREIAAVLPVGGLSIHVVPWLWPTHSEPNDFWRMSDAGLRQLFGPDLGFEILDSGGHYAAAVTPHPSWRELNPDVATLLSSAMCWVIARKVEEPSPVASWPYDTQAGGDLAREYPLDGIIVPIREGVE